MSDDTDSVELALDYAREQFTHIGVLHEQLVGRATNFLGLLAVFIGLVAGAPFRGNLWRAVSSAGLVFAIVALALFVWLVRLKTYKFTPDTDGLIKYLDEHVRETRLQLLVNTQEAIKHNKDALRREQTVYQWAVALAAIGTALVGAGVVLTLAASLLGCKGV